MTVIEKQYMESVISINRMMRKAQDAGPDWEQRRFEIAKDISAAMLSALTEGAIRKGAVLNPNYSHLAEISMEMADALIAELKATGGDGKDNA